MKLTAFTNYALRTLQMAAIRTPQITRIDDVASAHGINRPHMVKVVHMLGKEGYLETVRGRGGGFRLARPPGEIRVGDVVRLTEGPIVLVECFHAPTNTCPLIGICRLSRKLDEATRAFLKVLDETTIADIAQNRDELMTRLAPLQPAP
jgi:Rrf2 family transcriptional regulator, nitric oxide-sensitive transcriptional repressor